MTAKTGEDFECACFSDVSHLVTELVAVTRTARNRRRIHPVMTARKLGAIACGEALETAFKVDAFGIAMMATPPYRLCERDSMAPTK